MNPISISQAFGSAPPRSPAVLCLQGPDGSTDMILVQWFTWLNIKRNPMISYAMESSASLGLNAEEKQPVYLAFPPLNEALPYKAGIRTAAEGKTKEYPSGISPVTAEGIPVMIPKDSQVVLKVTIAGSYKYPFRKVRIFNCNLEEALGEYDDEITI